MATIKTSLMIHDGMTGAIQKMYRAVNILVESFEEVQRTSGKAVDTSNLREARQLAAESAAAWDQMADHIREADQAQQGFNSGLRAASPAADALNGKLKAVLATVGGIAGLNKVFRISDQLASTNARLNNAQATFDDGGGLAELQKKVMASAQRSRSAYMDTAAAVAKLGMNAKDAFGNMDEVIGFSELINKQFVIGGASAQEQSAAMLQLTQALASGVLRGDELRSVFEQAPGIIQNIADYLNVPIGEIRDMAAEGQITADIVKNATFAAADQIEERFSNMPKTWAQIWNSMKNYALSIFNPILNKLNQIANSAKFEAVTNGIINGLVAIASVASWVLDLLINGASWVVDNWGWISPIVLGVAGAFAVFQIAAHWTQIAAAATAIYHGVVNFLSIGFGILTGNTAAASAAVFTFNSALLANPIVWVVMLIMALIGALYAGVAAYNKFTGAGVSATGIIGGAFAVLGAFLINSFIVPLQNGFAMIANFFGNVFRDPVAAVKVLFYDMCLTVLGYISNLAHAIEDLINKIPGVQVSITAGLDGLYNRLESAQKKVKDESGWVEYVKKMNFINYSDAAKAGYNFGKGVADKVSSVFKLSDYTSDMEWTNNANNLGNQLDSITNNTNGIADNTAATAQALGLSNEDLKLLREIAERQAINQFTTAEIKVEMNNNNTIASDVDLDGITDKLADKLQETMETTAEGVHT